jgi:hypothetical protein
MISSTYFLCVVGDENATTINFFGLWTTAGEGM